MKFEVEFYETSNGKCPVEDFLLNQDEKIRAKITRDITLLEDKGNLLREPYSKHLEDGIFELRTKQGNNITRILYFFVIGNKIVLTNGFIKKTQKTPAKEIKTAKEYRNDYLSKE